MQSAGPDLKCSFDYGFVIEFQRHRNGTNSCRSDLTVECITRRSHSESRVDSDR